MASLRTINPKAKGNRLACIRVIPGEVRGLKGPGVMAVRLETRRSCLE